MNTSIRSIRILLADDHTVMRAGLRLLLERQPNLTVVGEAADGALMAKKSGPACGKIVECSDSPISSSTARTR